MLITALAACGSESTNSAVADEQHSGHAHDSEPRPALPRFDGPTLGGGSAGTDLFQGRRGLIFLFSAADENVIPAAKIIHQLESEAKDANILFLGISRDTQTETAEAFVEDNGFAFPIIRDPRFQITTKLETAAGQPGLVLVDAEGQILVRSSSFPDDPEVAKAWEDQVRELLRLEKHEATLEVQLGLRPKAPAFDVQTLGGEPVTLEGIKAKAIVVVFFLPTCPHCHSALQHLNRLYKDLKDDGLEIIAISVSNKVYVIEDMAERFELSFPIHTDPDAKAQHAYGSRGGVPDLLILNSAREVVTRQKGWGPRIQAIVSMSIRNTLGVTNPMLLSKEGYSGQETCQSCHTTQHATWSLSQHAHAFDTLVKHGEDTNPECLGCHTVGWEKKGGYSLDQPQPYLEAVQCENCHGRGGPHQSPEFAKVGFEAQCLTCHTPDHSLNFKFAEALPLISHAMNADVLSLSLEERVARLKQGDVFQRDLFATAEYVGSPACESCHVDQHKLWSERGHARAFDTLVTKNEAGNDTCLKCHTTGFGEIGGFTAKDSPDHLKGVGCESCHGPGGDHVAENARKKGTILRLTEKCDSCVILQICGSCHDDVNDAGFEFELKEKLERIRHGSPAGDSAE